jgi:hypothetical protein
VESLSCTLARDGPVRTRDEYPGLSPIQPRQTPFMLTIVLTENKGANNLSMRATEGKLLLLRSKLAAGETSQ